MGARLDDLHNAAAQRHLSFGQCRLAIFQHDHRSGPRQSLVDGQAAGREGARNTILPRRQNIDAKAAIVAQHVMDARAPVDADQQRGRFIADRTDRRGGHALTPRRAIGGDDIHRRRQRGHGAPEILLRYHRLCSPRRCFSA
jgi:hypothetical protein